MKKILPTSWTLQSKLRMELDYLQMYNVIVLKTKIWNTQ